MRERDRAAAYEAISCTLVLLHRIVANHRVEERILRKIDSAKQRLMEAQADLHIGYRQTEKDMLAHDTEMQASDPLFDSDSGTEKGR